MPDIGVPELLIIAAIVLLVFGPGKAADLGASLGKGIREFRKATKEEDEPTAPASTNVLASASGPSAGGSQTASANGAAAGTGRFCTECGTPSGESQKFCTNCGTSLTAKA
ncbi:MAG TPA: twin-arginine translocase TatA/TatE family subunit [Dehalococcoidia bacterium]|nr:twin-arginine translocase TatA/TatE family subunit [Dehalococcoidia bacterium]